MPHFITPSGTDHKLITASWVNPAGADWKRVLARWIGTADGWKQFFIAGTVALQPATVRSFAYTPDVPESKIEFAPNGPVQATFTDQTMVTTNEIFKWFDPVAVGAGSGFEILAKRISGLATAVVGGDDLDTWLSLATPRSWSITGAGAIVNRARAVTLEIAIRVIGQTEPLSVAQVTLSTVTYQTSNPNGTYGRGGGIDMHTPYRFAEIP